MSRSIDIQTAEVFEPLLQPARYKGLHGGRGSGKSHFFAEDAIDHALRWHGESGEGLRLLCFREVQKSLKESAKFLLESKIKKFNLKESDGFKVYNDRIALPNDGLIAFTGLQDHTADSIKSYEGFHIAWGEEAQAISHHSISLLRPTIRWEDKARGMESELWFSWNPRHKRDAVDQLLRVNTPTNATVVHANWSDNPWFPGVLEQERIDCLNNEPDYYGNIWEGDYVSATEGAYFAKHIAAARKEGRMSSDSSTINVDKDPLLVVKLFADIGGTGAKSDAFSFWAAQFVGTEIRLLNYYESQGQPIDAHLAWLRENGYTSDRAEIVLPHDGKTQDRVLDVSYESAFKQAGYKVTVIPNQGKGAAKQRIEAGRRLFSFMRFDSKCKGGEEALGWYHEKKDETRNIGLGPDHDWSSHAADSFGLVCIFHEIPKIKKVKNNRAKINIA